MSKTAVLAFSGGLDTSFCVPYLMDRGWDVVTLFVDTGGVSEARRDWIEQRALALGAVNHVTQDAGDELWESFVTPFVMGGAKYQDQYPLLCSDRYVIANRAADLAHTIGASAIAHGCTAMGNDQVRFDHALGCLTTLPILAPVRDLQDVCDNPREHEIRTLREQGHEVSADVSAYTINENLLGVTVSGSEIDDFDEPSAATHILTSPPEQLPAGELRVSLGFDAGRAVSLDGRCVEGPELLRELNALLGPYGVGRGVYTGDTVIGLKGRIVYEAPGLEALLTAHRALEECTLSREQNRFKPLAARKWTELVYAGLFFEPLRDDLEALIRSTQSRVSGEVTLLTRAGRIDAVAIRSDHILRQEGAVYAQRAGWSCADAVGFIKLGGLASAMAANAARGAACSKP